MIVATSIEQGITTLLKKRDIHVTDWKILKKGNDDYTDILVLPNGVKVPLLWWRYHLKLNGIYSITRNRIGELCSVKSYSFEPKDTLLKDVLYREIDLAQWWLNSKAKYVVAMESSNLSGNYLIKMHNHTVANIEISCTLPIGAEAQQKHTVFGREGMSSDRVVDTMIVENSIYLYNDGPNPKTFTDTDSWLYGLSSDEIAKAYCAAMLIAGKEDSNNYIESDSVLKKIVEAARKSAITNERIYINGD